MERQVVMPLDRVILGRPAQVSDGTRPMSGHRGNS